ncbi:hypothetical protein ACLOJK_040630 [Asimina triloba]
MEPVVEIPPKEEGLKEPLVAFESSGETNSTMPNPPSLILEKIISPMYVRSSSPIIRKAPLAESTFMKAEEDIPVKKVKATLVVHDTHRDILRNPDLLLRSLEKSFPPIVRIAKAREFTKLKQSGMFVVDYETKFSALIHFAPNLIIDDETRIRRFHNGVDESI